MFPVICKDMECLFELLVKSIQYALNVTLISKTKLPPTQEAMTWRRSVNTSKLISMTPKPITYISNYIYSALISINVKLGQSIVKNRLEIQYPYSKTNSRQILFWNGLHNTWIFCLKYIEFDYKKVHQLCNIP